MRRTRFVADAMLGSLARKLRALGFDATYYRDGDDEGLIRLAKDEGRVLLTSDRPLSTRAKSRGARVILLIQGGDASKISEVNRAARSMSISLVRGEPLCSLCGGELEHLGKGEVMGRVPPSVARSHRLFFRCVLCGQLYWRGSHWKKLMSLAKRLDSKPHDIKSRRREEGGHAGEEDPGGPRKRLSCPRV